MGSLLLWIIVFWAKVGLCAHTATHTYFMVGGKWGGELTDNLLSIIVGNFQSLPSKSLKCHIKAYCHTLKFWFPPQSLDGDSWVSGLPPQNIARQHRTKSHNNGFCVLNSWDRRIFPNNLWLCGIQIIECFYILLY